MKSAYPKILMFLSLVLVIPLSSCEESSTVEIEGPNIAFLLSFAELESHLQRSATSDYVLVATSDTIKGQNIESYLTRIGQDYTSVVEAATIRNALLELSQGADFTGVKSLEFKYQLVGTNEEITLTKVNLDGSDNQSISFSDIRIDKKQAFDFIQKNVIGKIYAIYDPTTVKCFQNGVSYRFMANTTLTVKQSTLAESLLGLAD